MGPGLELILCHDADEWAVINPVWAALEREPPASVLVIGGSRDDGVLQRLERLAEVYGVALTTDWLETPDGDMKQISGEIRAALAERDPERTLIDVTEGCTMRQLALFQAAFSFPSKSLLCLVHRDVLHVPYPLLDRRQLQHVDLREVARA